MAEIAAKTIIMPQRTEEISEKDLLIHLKKVTGCDYIFAQTSERKMGPHGEVEKPKGAGRFIQLMPKTQDKGFFDWYCNEREWFQFFTTMEKATLFFLIYYKKWEEMNNAK